MSQERPNILFLMADQFRTRTLTGMGDGIQTPNIDRIRSMGCFFPQASCASPLCVPSRAALATGRYPHRCGVLHDYDNLAVDQDTYYRRLRDAGYRVGVVGKTDLHKNLYPCEGEYGFYTGRSGALPVMYSYGFTDVLETEGKMNSAYPMLGDDGELKAAGPYQQYLLRRGTAYLGMHFRALSDYMRSKRAWYARATELPWEDTIDSYIGREAIRMIDRQEDAPWHILVSFVGPHNPWDPPKESLESVAGLPLELPAADSMEKKPEWVRKRAERQSRGLDREELLNTKRHYAASVKLIDDWVGRILDHLEERGELEKTAIIFCADHGEMMGEHGLFEKRCMYEGALRVPMLIHLPGQTEAAEYQAQAQLIDLAPTILEMCHIPNSSEMDGRSLGPVMRGEKQEVHQIIFSELDNTDMLCDGRYKWIHSWNDREELYDLTEDPEELHNIIGEQPQIVRQLKDAFYRPHKVDRRAVEKISELG